MPDPHPRVPVTLSVNGELHSERLSPTLLLTDYLRDHLRLTGTHVGCDTSQCGACTVLVDGLTVKACTVLAVSLDGARVETVESLSGASGLHPVQSAFRNRHALQCGFCTPGVMMTAVGLLRENPHPSAAEIREGLDGVICRCTGYENIVQAISEAAAAPAAGEAI
ncbi:MAG: (2Fe-2S)-binding protein [Clostridia bacterium]